MDIQSLGLMSSIAAQGNINSIVDKGNRPSFAQFLAQIGGINQINHAVNTSNNAVKCGDEFEKLLQRVNEDTGIAEMKKFLDEKFNINTVVVDYGCAKTDTRAEIYDTAMLKEYDMHGGRNVVISRKALLRMQKDSAFRQKVYQSIGDIPWSSKLTGGEVKSNGVFIHEDGTGGYYLEFDWGDEEDAAKPQKSKASYADSSELKSLDVLKYDEFNDVGVQTGFWGALYRREMAEVRKTRAK
ncbi:MAG: hypothetical protein NC092_11225 [Butyrivibrio sp.]|nr:hypothetical protein [Muribaculum sp.]MCM1553252.1 hypothetical protein [Butyrivibrio sp.]